jgi:hypothetical protein
VNKPAHLLASALASSLASSLLLPLQLRFRARFCSYAVVCRCMPCMYICLALQTCTPAVRRACHSTRGSLRVISYAKIQGCRRFKALGSMVAICGRSKCFMWLSGDHVYILVHM